MSNLRKAANITYSILEILLALIILLVPDTGFVIVFTILVFLMIAGGIKDLIFYFTMARHMVGGKTLLYRGLILLDFGAFSLGLADVPKFFLILYMLGVHAFSGAIEIMRALEARSFGSSWHLNMSFGIANIVIALFAVVSGFIFGSMTFVTAVYALGLVYSAIGRILRALRKNAVVFIQM